MTDDHPGTPKPGLFRDVILAPDRDRDFSPFPVVSVSDEDEPDYLAEIEARARTRSAVSRRGVEYGEFAALEPTGLLEPRPRRRRREALVRERWVAAQPLLFPGAFAADASRAKGLTRGLYERLERGEFETWLRGRAEALGPRYLVDDFQAPLVEPDRDLARATLSSRDGLQGFWVKYSRLSAHEGDTSRRLRLSFGVEGDDDASTDEERHAALAEIARPLFPGFVAAERDEQVLPLLRELVGAEVLLTQPIGYWNTAGGGVRFHHDSFAENQGQRGVLFVQLTGRSFWLALSIRDLADRVREFVGEGDVELEPEALELTKRPAAVLEELGLAGCGRFGALVDAPNFAGFLADAGHAAFLEEGDAIVLPNHGLDRTTMHSVFGVARRPAYGLSLAIRAR